MLDMLKEVAENHTVVKILLKKEEKYLTIAKLIELHAQDPLEKKCSWVKAHGGCKRQKCCLFRFKGLKMIKNKCRFNRVVCKRRKVLKCYKKIKC